MMSCSEKIWPPVHSSPEVARRRVGMPAPDERLVPAAPPPTGAAGPPPGPRRRALRPSSSVLVAVRGPRGAPPAEVPAAPGADEPPGPPVPEPMGRRARGAAICSGASTRTTLGPAIRTGAACVSLGPIGATLVGRVGRFCGAGTIGRCGALPADDPGEPGAMPSAVEPDDEPCVPDSGAIELPPWLTPRVFRES